jgi:hypothetical protein
MVSEGTTFEVIARTLGMCPAALHSKRKKDKKLSDVIERGRDQYEEKRKKDKQDGTEILRGHTLGKKLDSKRVYVSVEEKKKLIGKTGNCCYLCGRHRSDFNRAHAIDHDHFTGRIRGILCTKCNLLVGHIEALMRNHGAAISDIRKYLGRDRDSTARRNPSKEFIWGGTRKRARKTFGGAAAC